MAYTNMTTRPAVVAGSGEAMAVNIKMSASMLDMIAASYTYLLLAAIREPIQNAMDEARRRGLDPAESVIVTLPTAENPALTVVDRGAGMTKDFMESSYLVLGESTKETDRGVAGGIGIGRWAGYAYCQECTITTCHASDMLARTYFQYQDVDGRPVVREVFAIPGEATGTTVSFPVKPDDFKAATFTVNWLRDIMQLTMNMSFKIEGEIQRVLPAFSGMTVDLGLTDPALAGIKLLPMASSELQYGLTACQPGSLIVLTNEKAGTGGLPFHVRPISLDPSVFARGVIISIPMSYDVAFMPSREEIKYEPMRNLMRSIDQAATKAMAAAFINAKNEHSVESIRRIQGVTGTMSVYSGEAHCFSTKTSDTEFTRMTKAAGIPHCGQFPVVTISNKKCAIRYWTGTVCKTVAQVGSAMLYSNGKATAEQVKLTNNDLQILVVDSNMTAAREWLNNLPALTRAIVLSNDDPTALMAAAEEISAQFNHQIKIARSSDIPAKAKVISAPSTTKSGIKLPRGSSLTFFDYDLSRQETAICSFAGDTPDCNNAFVVKGEKGLEGFKNGVTLSSLNKSFSHNITDVMSILGLDRVYILTKKQYADLQELINSYRSADLWDCDLSTLSTADAEAIVNLKKWIPFTELMIDFVETDELIKEFREEKRAKILTLNFTLKGLLKSIAKDKPFCLKGTKFDEALSYYGDYLVDDLLYINTVDSTKSALLYMEDFGKHLDPDYSPEIAKSKEIFNGLCDIGIIDYDQKWLQLTKEFPLLAAADGLSSLPEKSRSDFYFAISTLYR